MEQAKSFVLLPDIQRSPESEFPNLRVCDFIISELEKLKQQYGDETIFTDWNTGASVTTCQLIRDAYKIASAIKRRGIQSGEIISCLIHSDVNYFSFLLATWMTGCVISSLQHSFPQELLLNILRKSRCKLLLCDQESAARSLQAKSECPDLEDVIVLGEFSGCIPFNRLLEGLELTRDEFKRTEPYDPDETVSIVFSSGTTGEPKGVLLTQQNIYSYLLTARPEANKPGMKTLFVPRIGNIMGLVFALRGVLIYTKMYLMSDYKDEWLFEAIEQIKPERALLYLPHILTIIKHPKSETTDLTSIQAVFTAGMPIGKRLQKMFYPKLPSLKTFFMFYGMTEFAIGTMRPFHDYEQNIYRHEVLVKNYELKPESVGRLCPMNQMKVVDEETGKILGPNQKGELCFKGPSRFKGYWNDPEATEHIIKDGWLHTGDIGYYDDDKDVFYIQRSKELIKYLGHHVIPSQLETILKSHPGVEDAAVIGVKSEEYGELPRAYAKKRTGYEKLKATNLINFLHDRVNDESLLRGGLVFIEEIPRNVMGKVVRNMLRERAEMELKRNSSG